MWIKEDECGYLCAEAWGAETRTCIWKGKVTGVVEKDSCNDMKKILHFLLVIPFVSLGNKSGILIWVHLYEFTVSISWESSVLRHHRARQACGQMLPMFPNHPSRDCQYPNGFFILKESFNTFCFCP
jgi:hypothetical protein